MTISCLDNIVAHSYVPRADLSIAIQWGYITLFVVAFPIAPIIAFIGAYLEMRVDTYRVLRKTSRTMPEGAQGKQFVVS